MEKRKLTKADIDKVRHIEGFPIAKDEDIIALSDAPYYTACPNPFIEEFIRENGKPYDEATDDYHREPFATDVSEGKMDPIYNVHSYHTKVPYKAIMRYILHYTDPDDIVFDGFCGTGMTGVAAQMCKTPDTEFKQVINKEMPHAKWGARNAVLNDLAPAATFIAYNYITEVNIDEFASEVRRILSECNKKCGWMYQTTHSPDNNSQMTLAGNRIMGQIIYTVWSDVLLCPNCGEEIVFWDVAVTKNPYHVNDKFHCSHCRVELSKKDCEYAVESILDERLNKTVRLCKKVPVQINYLFNGKRYEKKPDMNDYETIQRINTLSFTEWYPAIRMCEGTESRRNDKFGIEYTHQFYTKRNLYTIAVLRSLNTRNNPAITFWLNSLDHGISKRVKHGDWSFPMSTMSGTLYIPSLSRENNPIYFYQTKADKMGKIFFISKSTCITTTQSSSSLPQIGSNTIDYIFTDPPFGDNLNYSELSFFWETWMKVITNNKTEAIINKTQNKGLIEYQQLMTDCFSEFYRILKPNRWMTVEFHNSKNAVWNAIQESLLRAGFIVADVRILDKQSGSFKQINSTSAVKQDLVISAYKPKDSFKREFISRAGSEENAWSFVHQHLENLPVVVVKNGKIELIAERQAFLLFDRMVAYHIMNGIAIPLDATDFYRGLDDKFLKRDGMYFLADQVNEYDTARIKNDVEDIQFSLIVSNEKTAIAWLYQQLATPQTYAEIQPKFMQEIKTVDKYEAIPELAVLLEDSFLQDDKGKWYIPDRTKEADIAKLREKKLLKEFEGYLATKGKLKLFRTEAIRVGFAKLWTDKNYKLIVDTADRLPEAIIQEDDKLIMYYDLSLGRV